MTSLLSRTRKRARALSSIAEALLTPHGVDRYLELVDPMLVRSEIRGEVTRVRRQTSDTVTLTIRPSSAWKGFRAGQFVRVTVTIDGVRRTRCYSPACAENAPGGEIELTIKAAADGLVSRHLRDHAIPGMVLGLSVADGEFTLPSPRPADVLLISGGSGITPVLSMLRTLAAENHPGKVTFLHYTRGESDLPYRTELAELGTLPGIRVVVAHTEEPDGGDLTGFFSAEHLRTAAPEYRRAQTYLCGPTPLMDSVREVFEDEQLGEQLHTEEFAPPAIVVDGAAATGTVRFTRSGTEFANSGAPLLDQAEDAGLSPEHGCRMGICFSCTKFKKSGPLRDVRTNEVSEDEDVDVQLCVSVPLGDVEIDA